MTGARALWATAALVLAPRVAAAQAEPRVTSGASARQVEVGEPFTVELKAMAEQGSPAATDPELRAPGFTVAGPSVSTQMIARSINGQASVSVGMGATWQLMGEKPGHFVLPAPSVLWNGKRIKATPIPIDVVPATGNPRSRRQSPFLMPGGPSFSMPWGVGRGFDLDTLDDDDNAPADELALDRAPDPQVFLRAVADKRDAVVGEQVTVSFYLYQRSAYELTERRDAPLADFLRVPLLANPGMDRPVLARVGDRKFIVRLLDRIALFPLHAGELHVGAMRVRVALRGMGARVQRESNDVALQVSEPPRDGRPPGYTLGDVGQFSINASVQPRKIDQGGSVAVQIRVSGKGYVPQAVRVPARTGVEWLDPEKREAVEPQGTVIGGWRSFGYVVRVKESGRVDLGKVELPYWDPASGRYQIASAALGPVEVTPVSPKAAPSASAGAAAADAPRDPFVTLPAARKALGSYTPQAGPIAEGASLWLLLAAPPLLVAVGSAGARAARSMREKRAASKSSSATLASAALREAAEAEAKGEAKAMAAAVERALHHAIEAATGLKSRGVLLAELAGELEARGLPAAVGARATAALEACEAVRFDPAASAERLAELGADARAVVEELRGRGRA